MTKSDLQLLEVGQSFEGLIILDLGDFVIGEFAKNRNDINITPPCSGIRLCNIGVWKNWIGEGGKVYYGSMGNEPMDKVDAKD